ncbi:hypothetical protein PUN71_019130 [Arthrobacter sp. NQ7]|uniref:hypothetical protein n=1 Tax=Arthrobacter sp. NQ7 TaxID=3032303 RepID=UPI00240F59A6|nr:hypothetical protein [Arthrobacter sp. NQ7]MDJ0459322.1 hypothetical protein [Arthrobacter sp. NQ7]
MNDELTARLVRQAMQATAEGEAVDGRPEAALSLRAVGLSVESIAQKLGCSTSVVQAALDTAAARRPRGLRREERFPYELHVLLAAKLRDHPELRDLARANIRRMRETPRAPMAEDWVDRWEEILDLSADAAERQMLRGDELGSDLRQMSPFAGALDQDERAVAMKKAQLLAGLSASGRS